MKFETLDICQLLKIFKGSLIVTVIVIVTVTFTVTVTVTIRQTFSSNSDRFAECLYVLGNTSKLLL